MTIMKRNRILPIFASALIAMTGSCSGFDDSALWNDVDNIYTSLTELSSQLEQTNAQLRLLGAVVRGGAITSITVDSDGNHVISYVGGDNVEHTVTVAVKEDVSAAPLLGTKEDGGVLYWTLTSSGKTDWLKDVDGSRIPVAGRTPQLRIDDEGYWTLNGVRLKDHAGNPVKAEGKSVSLITSVVQDGEKVDFTLSDGSIVSAPVFGAFGIVLKYAGEIISPGIFRMEDSSEGRASLTYELTGKNAGTTAVRIVKVSGLGAVLDKDAGIISLTWEKGFEEGHFTLLLADGSGNVLVKNIKVVAADTAPEYYGIKTAGDFIKFVSAVNSGASLGRWRGPDGSIVLLGDIDFSGVGTLEPAGGQEMPFTDVFDGNGYALINLDISYDLSVNAHCGIFGYACGAVIRNLTVGSEGSRMRADGSGAGATGIRTLAGVLGYSDGCTVENCTNNCEITTGRLANTGSGATGIQLGGIAGFLKGKDIIKSCTNNGRLSAPAGRQGGIVGTSNAAGCTIENCTNNALVEDDVIGQFASENTSVKRMGGIAGGNAGTIAGCCNNGTVKTWLSSRTGGFVGHNTGTITGCTNNGDIIGDFTANHEHGPGWACGYSNQFASVTGNKGYGHVNGEPAMYSNALCYQVYKFFDTEKNTVDWTLDEYFAWTETETRNLHPAVVYHHYSCTYVPRHINVLEIDMTDPSLELTTAYADDIVPNPNANRNANNGFCIRETLSQLCERKRSEGQNIIAGINTGFFDSNDGISRGPHIEEGELVYANNPSVRASLSNHDWAFTVFTDRTSSCGKKTFGGGKSTGPVGKFSIEGKEYAFYSVNDTILRHASPSWQANAYTSRYRKTPHPEHPQITNPLATNVLYVVAEYVSDKARVNAGYAEAVITAVHDGRSSALAEAPYLDDPKQIAFALSGTVAEEVAASAKAGSAIRIRTDMAIDGESKPVFTQNSTMFSFLTDGQDKSESCSANHTNRTQHDPVTFVTVSEDRTKVWLIEVDGRKNGWSMGLKSYEMYRIAKKLGGWNQTRFDGGGSSAMWVYDAAAQSGSVVNVISDSKGERSCMNYILLRAKAN